MSYAVVSALLFVSVAAGYSLRWLHEGYQHRQRERVLRALGGALPDWEVGARALEEEAHECAMRGDSYRPAELREQADITRRRGRQRDRQWA
jgi:hypothetical protein